MNFNSYSDTTSDMEKTVIFLWLLALAQGRVLNFNTRIVNGTDVKLGEIPYQVSLQAYDAHFCGGSVLNENYVVTAAHCLEQFSSPGGIKVIVGTINVKEPGQTRQAVQITVHEGYSPANSYKNDIALIKVDRAFEFSELVQPVPLPDFHAQVAVNSTAIVSGWGNLGGPIPQLPDVLQKVDYWIADTEFCKEAVEPQGYTIHPTQICAIDRKNRRGECNGDSGGPVTVDGKLTGIVSWSLKDPYCASPKYPGVHTRVSEYIDWISKHAV